MADINPLFLPGARITFTASGALTGGNLVVPTGDRRIARAGAAAANCIGVTERDAVAEQKVPVGTNGVYELVAAAAVAAGDVIRCAANGEAEPIGAGTVDQRIGKALTGAAAGAKFQALLNIA